LVGPIPVRTLLNLHKLVISPERDVYLISQTCHSIPVPQPVMFRYQARSKILTPLIKDIARRYCCTHRTYGFVLLSDNRWLNIDIQCAVPLRTLQVNCLVSPRETTNRIGNMEQGSGTSTISAQGVHNGTARLTNAHHTTDI
jgi:hypothetical protein